MSAPDKEKRFKEQRKYPRKVSLLDVEYSAGESAFKDFSKDISNSGIFIETRNPLSVGDEILLTIQLAGEGEEIKISGEVVRTDSQGIGVRFKDVLRDDMIKSIQESIRLTFSRFERKDYQQAKQKLEDLRRQLRHNQLAFILPTLFGPLDDTTFKDIEAQVEWVYLDSSEALFHQGDPGDSCYIVIHGRLQAVARDEKGKERVVGEVARGECVGEMSIFTGEARTVSIFAVRDSELVKFSKAAFEKIIRRHPQVMMKITRILIDRLSKAMRSPSAASTVVNIAVVPVSEGVLLADFTSRLVKTLSVFGSTLHLSSRFLDEIMGVPGTAQIQDDVPYSIRLETWLDEQESKHSFVVYEADGSFSPWTMRCLKQADQILLVAQASATPEPGETGKLLLGPDSEITAVRRTLILLHPDGSSQPSGTANWLVAWPVEIHHHIRRDTHSDFERLARFLTGNAVGLVLGGGGARGFAHIGVVRALVEEGIPIDIIGGTSMGATIATGYAMGLDFETSMHAARRSFLETNPFNDYTLPFISLIKSRKLDYIARRQYGDLNIEDLWINYFCVSSNLTTAETVVHRRGRLWKAVRASGSIPGIVLPVLEKGSLLVDGGVLNNLPGDIMRQLSGGPVVAVDVSTEKELPLEYEKIPSPWEVLWRKISPFKESFNIPNILDIMTRTSMLASVNRMHLVRNETDFYLQPPLDRFKLMDFSALDEITEIGYRYTKEKIGELKDREPFKTLLGTR